METDQTPTTPQPAAQPESPAPKPAVKVMRIADLVSDTELPPKKKVGRPKGATADKSKKKLLGENPSDHTDEADDDGPQAETRENLSDLAKLPPKAFSTWIFDAITGMLSGLDPAWQASSVNERSGVISGLTEYFEASGFKGVSPGVAVWVIVIGYCAPRLFGPTKTRAFLVGLLKRSSKVIRATTQI
jgi:hypothetical protein